MAASFFHMTRTRPTERISTASVPRRDHARCTYQVGNDDLVIRDGEWLPDRGGAAGRHRRWEWTSTMT
jgi:hypothetical protein